MLASSDLRRIVDACKAIGDEIADDSGFVSMRRLLGRFEARLLIRPMLVEGMLASIERKDEPITESSQWAVLVDRETYGVNDQAIESESQNRPLPPRLRNTIAHELVHSLAFRPSEFGISLKLNSQKSNNLRDLVRAIERHTERLSPLLLWSERALNQLLLGKREPLSVEQLAEARRSVAISRPVLINRLHHLHLFDTNDFLFSPALQNLAVGLAEWRKGGRSVVRSWPLFANFSRNILPVFLRDISRQDRSPAEAVFPEETFVMCGGPNNNVELVADAGTAANPRVTKMKVQLSAESGSRKPGSKFLFVARIPTASHGDG